MASYKTREESWERHQSYAIDTEIEGKYEQGHWGSGRATAIVEAIPDGSLVLEMGCNSGGLSMLLMQNGCLVHGVDVAPIMVMRAYAKGVRAKVAPAEDTGFEANHFDAVITSELLEHVYEPGDVLKEVARVLKPGGILVGTVPHEKSFNTKRCSLDDHHYHARTFDEESLREPVEKYLEEVKIRTIAFVKPPAGRKLPWQLRVPIKKGSPQWYLFTGQKPS